MTAAGDAGTQAGTTVLLLGGTGRTGSRVLEQLLARGVHVRAVVRSAGRLPAGVAADPLLHVTEADLLGLTDADLAELARGCDAVISCLGHTVNLRGLYGAPRDLVTQTARRVCRALEALRSERPAKFVLMTSVSVNRRGRQDGRRSTFERLVVWALRGLVPPARDNQRAADALVDDFGTADPFVEWVVVRPDSLREGDISAYLLHEGVVDSLFRPGHTAMANIADFMCELVTDPDAWAAWRGKLPVVVDAPA